MMRQEWVVELHGTVRVLANEQTRALVYILETDDPESIERELADASPGQFVSVPIRGVNGPMSYRLHIQPHLWGAWSVYQTVLDDGL